RLAEEQRRRKLFADVEAKRKGLAARRSRASQPSVPPPPPPALSPSPAAMSPAVPPQAFPAAAPRRVVALPRSSSPLVTAPESARGQQDRRARDDNFAGGSSRGDRASGYGVNAREDRRPHNRNSRYERRSRSRSRSLETDGNRGSRRESGRSHQQRGQEEWKSARGNSCCARPCLSP
ncbi:unnamed protein product, partial [Ectocarpus fasciculatus]